MGIVNPPPLSEASRSCLEDFPNLLVFKNLNKPLPCFTLLLPPIAEHSEGLPNPPEMTWNLTSPALYTLRQLSRILCFQTFEISEYFDNCLWDTWRLWGWHFLSICNQPTKLQLVMENHRGPVVKPLPCFPSLQNNFQWIPHPKTTLGLNSCDFRTIFGQLLSPSPLLSLPLGLLITLKAWLLFWGGCKEGERQTAEGVSDQLCREDRVFEDRPKSFEESDKFWKETGEGCWEWGKPRRWQEQDSKDTSKTLNRTRLQNSETENWD